MSNDTVTATDGTELQLVAMNQAFTYSGNFIATITVALGPQEYVQTFTNNGTQITNISQWVAQ